MGINSINEFIHRRFVNPTFTLTLLTFLSEEDEMKDV